MLVVKNFSAQEDSTELKLCVEKLYAYQTKECHGAYGLAENGAQMWLDSFVPTLGLYSNIILLMDSAKNGCVGFIALRLKAYPKYLNAQTRGQISEMFVDPTFRTQGAGRMLVMEAQKWFLEKNIRHIELNTVAGNVIGEAFWKKMGFTLELQQWSSIVQGI
jgi:GNAT superfamily N-acetyltransferase